MIHVSARITTRLICLVFCVISASCKFNADPMLSDCPPCPNNTHCIDGDCGCPDGWYDMGSWCLKKEDNLFVAGCLDCPCLDVMGLYLLDIKPETGNGSLPVSIYSIVGRSNSGSGLGNLSQNFSYYQRPDGDSIAIFGILIPENDQWSCPMNDSLNCQIDLLGKFRGPDTIETQVLWRRCLTDNGEPGNFQKTAHLTFVRKK